MLRHPKPLVSWAGGKRRLLKHLLPLIPSHVCYAEVFGGGGAMLFAKERSKLEVYNDINGELVNLYRQVKWHPAELRNEIALVPSSRELFRSFMASHGLTEIQRAARFLLINRWSFGGLGDSYGISKIAGGGGGNVSLLSLSENVSAVSQRLDRVNIENLDWRKVFAKYDGPSTFFFVDPPYIRASDTNYSAWFPEEMLELRAALELLQGSWLLTVDDSPECRQIFAGLPMRSVGRANGIENRPGRKRNKVYHELIIGPKLPLGVPELRPNCRPNGTQNRRKPLESRVS
ncbi:DNA adenine methylase [Luteolibacter sp. GHJ8]|uniref:site-specific DNA-methyltransferase (adenine-specific) n=1 Tax=Luteolibacter rhizosphaerae TaxID=2989719 RepID=A0ABT3GAC1_9BACT|nr:DNA adenine methylase [Luteolibacter rhizosphaerae]MCW1916777.1 DNA adenine methylase [Luteolibacter rhizosphaerae]